MVATTTATPVPASATKQAFSHTCVGGELKKSLGFAGTLPVIAIGPHGGKIVGYTVGHKPIYAGSAEAKKLEQVKADHAAHTNTVHAVLDWLKHLGVFATTPGSSAADDTSVVMPLAHAEKLAAAFGVPFHQSGINSLVSVDDLAPHIGKPLVPAKHEAASVVAALAAGKFGTDAPFSPETVTSLKVTGNLGGSHGGKIVKDDAGNQYAWKNNHGDMVPTYAEAFAFRIGRLVFPKPDLFPEAEVVKHGGDNGVLISWVPGSPLGNESSGDHGVPTASLQKHFSSLVQHQVVDWLISNHDSHGANFHVLPNGELAAIDKGQALKFIMHDELSTTYKPNNSAPVYNAMWALFQQGKIKGNPIVDVQQVLARIRKLSPQQYEAILQPYIEVFAKEKGQSYANNIKKAALGRLGSMVEDWEKFLTSVVGKPVKFEFPEESVPLPVTTVQTVPEIPKDEPAPVKPIQKPGWPMSIKKTTVHHPGDEVPAGVKWKKNYPGPGFHASTNYKGKQYSVEFGVAEKAFAATVTFPNGEKLAVDSPNAASDAIVVFANPDAGLNYKSFTATQMKEKKLGYSFTKLFQLDQFAEHLSAAASGGMSGSKDVDAKTVQELEAEGVVTPETPVIAAPVPEVMALPETSPEPEVEATDSPAPAAPTVVYQELLEGKPLDTIVMLPSGAQFKLNAGGKWNKLLGKKFGTTGGVTTENLAKLMALSEAQTGQKPSVHPPVIPEAPMKGVPVEPPATVMSLSYAWDGVKIPTVAELDALPDGTTLYSSGPVPITTSAFALIKHKKVTKVKGKWSNAEGTVSVDALAQCTLGVKYQPGVLGWKGSMQPHAADLAVLPVGTKLYGEVDYAKDEDGTWSSLATGPGTLVTGLAVPPPGNYSCELPENVDLVGAKVAAAVHATAVAQAANPPEPIPEPAQPSISGKPLPVIVTDTEGMHAGAAGAVYAVQAAQQIYGETKGTKPTNWPDWVPPPGAVIEAGAAGKAAFAKPFWTFLASAANGDDGAPWPTFTFGVIKDDGTHVFGPTLGNPAIALEGAMVAALGVFPAGAADALTLAGYDGAQFPAGKTAADLHAVAPPKEAVVTVNPVDLDPEIKGKTVTATVGFEEFFQSAACKEKYGKLFAGLKWLSCYKETDPVQALTSFLNDHGFSGKVKASNFPEKGTGLPGAYCLVPYGLTDKQFTVETTVEVAVQAPPQLKLPQSSEEVSGWATSVLPLFGAWGTLPESVKQALFATAPVGTQVKYSSHAEDDFSNTVVKGVGGEWHNVNQFGVSPHPVAAQALAQLAKNAKLAVAPLPELHGQPVMAPDLLPPGTLVSTGSGDGNPAVWQKQAGDKWLLTGTTTTSGSWDLADKSPTFFIPHAAKPASAPAYVPAQVPAPAPVHKAPQLSDQEHLAWVQKAHVLFPKWDKTTTADHLEILAAAPAGTQLAFGKYHGPATFHAVKGVDNEWYGYSTFIGMGTDPLDVTKLAGADTTSMKLLITPLQEYHNKPVVQESLDTAEPGVVVAVHAVKPGVFNTYVKQAGQLWAVEGTDATISTENLAALQPVYLVPGGEAKAVYPTDTPAPSQQSLSKIPYEKKVCKSWPVTKIIHAISKYEVGTKLVFPNGKVLIKQQTHDASETWKLEGDTGITGGNTWVAHKFSGFGWGTATVVPPGAAVKASVPSPKKAKELAAKLQAAKEKAEAAKAAAAEQLAKLGAFKAWEAEHPKVTDPEILETLAWVAHSGNKKPFYAHVGEGGTLLLGKESDLPGLGLSLKEVDSPLGPLVSVSTEALKGVWADKLSKVTGPDGKLYPAGTTFAEHEVKVGSAHDLVAQISGFKKIKEHKSPQYAADYKVVKFSPLVDVDATFAALKQAGVNPVMGPSGPFVLKGESTIFTVSKADLAQSITEKKVVPEIPEQPKPFYPKASPFTVGSQMQGTPAVANSADLDTLDSIKPSEWGHNIRIGHPTEVWGSQLLAKKVVDASGNSYTEIHGELMDFQKHKSKMSGGHVAYYVSDQADQYNPETGVHQHSASTTINSFDGVTCAFDNGTYAGVVTQKGAMRNRFVVRIPQGVDVRAALTEAFTSMGVNADAALADHTEHSELLFKKQQIARTYMGASAHEDKSKFRNEAWLDKYLADFVPNHEQVLAESVIEVGPGNVHHVVLNDIDDAALDAAGVHFVSLGYSTYGDAGSSASIEAISSRVARALTHEGWTCRTNGIVKGTQASGGSESMDMLGGGAIAVYARVTRNDMHKHGWTCVGSHTPYRPVFHRDALKRADCWVTDGDTLGDLPTNDRKAALSVVSSKNEANFEKGLGSRYCAGIWCISEEARTELMLKLKKEGVEEINGHPIAKFLFTGANSAATIRAKAPGLQKGGQG